MENTTTNYQQINPLSTNMHNEKKLKNDEGNIKDTEMDSVSAVSLNKAIITNTKNSDIANCQCEIYQKLVELCHILDYLNWSALSFGSYISAKMSHIDESNSISSYNVILIPPLKPLSSLKMTDLIVSTSDNCDKLCKTISIHKIIYDTNPSINFIVHSCDESVTAVSSMKCGLLNISKESAMLGLIAYYPYSFIDELDDVTHDANLISSIAESRILFLKNSGALCYGSTIEEAFHYVVHLGNACKIQTLLNISQQTISDHLYYYEPKLYNFMRDQTKNGEFFKEQYLFFHQQAQRYMGYSNNCILGSPPRNKKDELSTTNTSSVDYFPSCNPTLHPNFHHQHFSNTLNEHVNRTNITPVEPKVNIPKCESSREVILSYEFRSNLTSSPTLTSNTENRQASRRRSTRFKAKRCYSLTSGVEKAIAKKIFDSTTTNEENTYG